MGNSIGKIDFLKVASFLGMGYYRVKESGEFIEATALRGNYLASPRMKLIYRNIRLNELKIASWCVIHDVTERHGRLGNFPGSVFNILINKWSI